MLVKTREIALKMLLAVCLCAFTSATTILVTQSSSLANPVNRSIRQPTVAYTGTFFTKEKVSTQGYEKEIVVQPIFLSQKLSDGRLRVFAHSQGGGIHNDHVAYFYAIVKLGSNGRAKFKQGSCTIDIQFRPGIVSVKDSGDCTECGFGEGSGIGGTYYLVDSKQPDFGKWVEPGEDPIESRD